MIGFLLIINIYTYIPIFKNGRRFPFFKKMAGADAALWRHHITRARFILSEKVMRSSKSYGVLYWKIYSKLQKFASILAPGISGPEVTSAILYAPRVA